MARIPALIGAVVALSCSLSWPAERSAAAILAFKRHNPCPATGQRSGSCPGWQIDHRIPLCLGGFDQPVNMQWLSVAEHKLKTKDDIRSCRMLRKLDQNSDFR